MRRLLVVLTLSATACHRQTPPPTKPACTDGLRQQPLRLLTRFEVDNTLRDLVQDDTHSGQSLPAEPLALGFDNNADVYAVTPDFQSRLLDLAEAVSANVVTNHRGALISCTTEDAACGAKFVESFGRRAFRRPLTPEERDSFGELFEHERSTETFDVALQSTVTAFILSPQFLYRLEPFLVPSGVERLDAYALASRLSYFLWGSMPDEALLSSAETGALESDDEFAQQTARLLGDPRALNQASHFYGLYLGLDALAGITKSPAQYPGFTAAMRSSWQQSIDLYVQELFAKEHTLKSALTSSVLFVDSEMGGMYGNGPVAPGSFMRLEMPGAQRAGLFTQPGFLARLSSPDQSSPVRRGVFVLQSVLCEQVAPPPPTVMAVPPPVDPTSTTRERFDVHAKTAGCSACHVRLDGLGFGFEHYDGIGAYRTTDNGKPVDATGNVTQVQDETLAGPFDGASELMSRLSTSRQVHDCMTTQWVRYALGRVETEGDACSITGVQQSFFDANGDLNTLRASIASSATFRYHVREEGQ